MKKILALALICLVSACAETAHQNSFPYGMSEKEWNRLSIRDQTMIRRDFFFFENGNLNLVNPNLTIEGRAPDPSPFTNQTSAAKH